MKKILFINIILSIFLILLNASSKINTDSSIKSKKDITFYTDDEYKYKIEITEYKIANNQLDKKIHPLILAGHSLHIRCLEISPDNKTFLTLGNDKTLKIWSMEDFRLIRNYPVKEKYDKITYSQDSGTIYCYIKKGYGYIDQISLIDGSLIKTIKFKSVFKFNNSEYYFDIGISPQCNLFIAEIFSNIEKIFIINSNSNKIECSIDDNGIDLTKDCISTSGKYIIVKNNIYSTNDGNKIQINKISTGYSTMIKFHPDGESIIINPENKKNSQYYLASYDLPNLTKRYEYKVGMNRINNFGTSFDGKYVYLIDTEHNINFYKNENPDPIFQIKSYYYCNIKTDTDSRYLLIVPDEGDMESRDLFYYHDRIVPSIEVIDIERMEHLHSMNNKHIRSDKQVMLSEDNDFLISCGNDENINIFDLKSGSSKNIRHYLFGIYETFNDHYDCAISYNSTQNNFVSYNPFFLQLNNTDKKQLKHKTYNDFKYKKISLSQINRDGSIIAVSYENGLAVFQDNLKTLLYKSNEGVNAIDFSPDNRYLVKGNKRGGVCIVDLESKDFKDNYITEIKDESQIKDTIFHRGSEALSIDWSPDGNYIAALMQSDDIILYDTTAEKIIWTIETKENNKKIKFSLDSQLLFSSEFDRSIIILDVKTGKQKDHIEFENLIRDFDISKGQKFLFAVDADGIKHIANLQTKEIIKLAQFKDGEWIAYASDGRFCSSSERMKYLEYSTGYDSFNPEKLKDKYYYKDLLKDFLSGKFKTSKSHQYTTKLPEEAKYKNEKNPVFEKNESLPDYNLKALYEKFDEHHKKITEQIDKDPKKLVKFILEPAASELEKVSAIYHWVTKVMIYNFLYKGCNHTFEDIFKSRQGVCDDYSKFIKGLCEIAGIEAVYISGPVKSFEAYNIKVEPHAWNAVKIEGKWYLLDATWSDKTTTDSWFLMAPDIFILSHHPYDDKWQLLENKVEMYEYNPLWDARSYQGLIKMKKYNTLSYINTLRIIPEEKISKPDEKEIYRIAVIEGNIDYVKKHYNKNDPNNTYYFLSSCSRGYVMIVDFFLEQSFDINLKDSSGYTPLIWAVMGSQVNMVEYLLLKGADKSIKDNKNKTAMDYAVEKKINPKILTILNEADDIEHGDMMMKEAIESGITDRVKKLFKNKDPLNEEYLFLAVTFKRHDIIEFLINSGVNVNARNKEKYTPLMFAASYGDYKMVKMLLDYSADKNMETEGLTALMFAVRSNALNASKELLELLIDKKDKSTPKLLLDIKTCILTDPKTGLIWYACPAGQILDSNGKPVGKANIYSWYSAKQICDKFQHAGYSDWRLPNIIEMISFYEYMNDTKQLERFYVDFDYPIYWVLEEDWMSSYTAVCVNFKESVIYTYLKDQGGYVLYVRGALKDKHYDIYCKYYNYINGNKIKKQFSVRMTLK